MATKTTQSTIPVDRIDPDPDQPRRIFDEIKLGELANSMRQLGQLQPITVRYQRSSRRYTIIMGERRWRAAQRAGLDQLHALVQHGVDDEEAFIKSVAENLGRADMTPLEEAQAFKRLADAGWPVGDIGRMCGKSVEYVGYRLDLLSLVPAASDALAKGHLPIGLAWYFAKLSPDSQHQLLTRWVRGGFASAREAEAHAQARREAERAANQGGLFPVDEPSPAEREQLQARRRQVTSKVDRLASAGAILQELAQVDPAELARVLAGADGGVAAYRLRVDHVKQMASKAAANLRKAAAVAAAATVDIDTLNLKESA